MLEIIKKENAGTLLAVTDSTSALAISLEGLSDSISEETCEAIKEAIDDLAHQKDYDEKAIARKLDNMQIGQFADLNSDEIKRMLQSHDDCTNITCDAINGIIPNENFQYGSQEEAEANGQEWPYGDRY